MKNSKPSAGTQALSRVTAGHVMIAMSQALAVAPDQEQAIYDRVYLDEWGVRRDELEELSVNELAAAYTYLQTFFDDKPGELEAAGIEPMEMREGLAEPNQAKLCSLSDLQEHPKFRDVFGIRNYWVWCTGIKRWVDRRNPLRQWDVIQFDSEFNRYVDTSSVSKYFFKTRQMSIARFDLPAFTPGMPEFNGRQYNTWRPSKVIPRRGDTTLWNAHLLWLFPDDATRKMVLDWLAWVYQHQDLKPNWALLLMGETFGTGKSFIARVLEHLLGRENTQRPKNSSLNGDFNAWAAHCKLILIEELMQMGRKEVEGALRDIITEPTIEVNIKHISAHKIPSYSAMIGITNKPDALHLNPGDRRWGVAESSITEAEKNAMKETDHFARLMPMVYNDAPDLIALGAIAYELKHRDLGKFDPRHDEPPLTMAKEAMIEYSKPSIVTWLENERDNDPFTRRVVSIPDDIVPLIPAHVMRDQSSRAVEMAIAKWLKRNLAGVNTGRVRVARRMMNLWAINGTDVHPSKAGAMYTADKAVADKIAGSANAADEFGA